MAPAGRVWCAMSIGLALSVAVVARGADPSRPPGGAASAKASEVPVAPGDASVGAALFTGAIAMRDGGAPCGACHAIGGHGSSLAASLGPDLSHSFDGMPAEAVDGMLQDLPFPTMTPIYTGHALTAQERAHLAAFLVTGSGAEPPGASGVARYAAGIAAVLVALLALGARRRKRPTRAGLVAHPPSPERPPLVPRRFHEPGDGSAEASIAPRSATGGSR